jgi:hypothetical protein
LALHDAKGLLRAEEDAGQVGLDHGRPLREGELFERHTGSADARVVEQEVEASEPRVDPGEERGHYGRIADVTRQRDGAAARLGGGLLERLDAATGQDDREACFGERDRRSAADPATGAGDQRDSRHEPMAATEPPSSSST